MSTVSTGINDNAVRLQAWLNRTNVRQARARRSLPIRLEDLEDNLVGARRTPEGYRARSPSIGKLKDTLPVICHTKINDIVNGYSIRKKIGCHCRQLEKIVRPVQNE
jgi:hypothetical protein